MKKIKILIFIFLSISGYAQLNRIDTIYNVASFYNKAYDLEHRHDNYIFKKLESYYLTVIGDDTLNSYMTFKISSLYFDESVYYDQLIKIKNMDNVKNRKLRKEYYTKCLFYANRYKRITGKKIKLDYAPD